MYTFGTNMYFWGTNMHPLGTKVYFLRGYSSSDSFCSFFLIANDATMDIFVKIATHVVCFCKKMLNHVEFVLKRSSIVLFTYSNSFKVYAKIIENNVEREHPFVSKFMLAVWLTSASWCGVNYVISSRWFWHPQNLRRTVSCDKRTDTLRHWVK